MKTRAWWVLSVLAVCGTLAGMPASAQDDPPSARWELGVAAGGGSQQAYPGADENTRGGRAIPYFIFRGERLRVDRGSVSVRALRTPAFELDIGTSGALGSSASDVKVREGMPDLGDLIEFGPRLTWNLGEGPGDGRWRLQLPLRGVFDLDDSLAWRGLTFEPEIEFSRRTAGGWRYSMSLSAIIGSERFNDLYYQVDPAFATPTRPAYDARAGLVTWRLAVGVSRWLSPDWRVFAAARVDHVAGAANRASPLVLRQAGGSVGVGVQWVFFRSQAPAPD
jgi:outer membrane scaffolding protein for murein synthesis (MipA/OmpV family)